MSRRLQIGRGGMQGRMWSSLSRSTHTQGETWDSALPWLTLDKALGLVELQKSHKWHQSQFLQPEESSGVHQENLQDRTMKHRSARRPTICLGFPHQRSVLASPCSGGQQVIYFGSWQSLLFTHFYFTSKHLFSTPSLHWGSTKTSFMETELNVLRSFVLVWFGFYLRGKLCRCFPLLHPWMGPCVFTKSNDSSIS